MIPLGILKLGVMMSFGLQTADDGFTGFTEEQIRFERLWV